MKIDLTYEECCFVQDALENLVDNIEDQLKYMVGDADYCRTAKVYIEALSNLSDKLSNHSFDENSCKTEQNLV